MKRNRPKSHILMNLVGLVLCYCRTTLHFFKNYLKRWFIPACLSVSAISCGPATNNHYNENKYIQTNSSGETRSGGGGGTGDGGGGQGILCSEEVTDQRIKGKLLVRDIFEAITNHGRQLKSIKNQSTEKLEKEKENPDKSNDLNKSNKIDPQAIKILVESIKHYFGPSSKNLDFTSEQYWVDFEKRISFINDETPLNYSQDANSPISLPAGCKIVQIAFWHESSGPSDDGTLYVDQKHWNKLDDFNKIALFAHEFFFKQARQAGYKNSDYIRNRVGQLLSVEGLDPMFKEWVPSKDPRVSDILPASMQGFKYCTGESTEDPSAKLQLYQYKGKDGLQHFVIPLIKSKSINISLLQSSHFSFTPTENQTLAKATDLWLFGINKPVDYSNIHNWSCLSNDCVNENFNLLKSTDYERIWRKLTFEHELLMTSNAFLNENSLFMPLKKEPSLWSSNINVNSEIVQISVLNPAFDFNGPSKAKMKPREEIINNLYSALMSDFMMFIFAPPVPGNDEIPVNRTLNEQQKYREQVSKKILNALSILNIEIDNAISSGIFPDGFPKWKSAVNDIWQSIDESKRKIIVKPMPLQEIALNKGFPNIIYKVKLNAHTAEDISYFTNDNIEEYPAILGIKPGKIQIQQGSSMLKFSLSCNDYKTIELLANPKKADLQINKNLNSNIEIKFQARDTNESKERKITELLKSIASIRSMPDMQNLINSYSKSCKQKDNFLGFSCDDLALLSNDLNTEKKMTVQPCQFDDDPYNTINWRSSYNHSCYILNLEFARSSYQMVNSVPKSNPSEQKIFFIRRIPYNHETDFEPTEGKTLEKNLNAVSSPVQNQN